MEGILVFIIGLVMGSFYLVVGTRLLKGESILKPRSHCTYCNHQLEWYDLVPILSYIMLKGKCRYCQKKLSFSYLGYELLTGVLFLISYLKFGISYDFFVSLIISSLLVLIFITDFKEMIILDSPLVAASILTIILKLIYLGFKETGVSLISAFLMLIIMLFIRQIGNLIFKRDSLGGGDIKLSFVMGLILNLRLSLVAVILSTFLAFPYALGSIVLNKDNEVAFGPFLVSALFIVYFFMVKFLNIFSFFY